MKNPAGSPRQVRIFLSSTFRDLMVERDYLVRRTIPNLQRRFRSRGVEVIVVDLRWGITQEEAEQGKVVPICLEEVEKCRPYFIGILGSRYGSVLPTDQIPPEVFESYPWMREHSGKSITELEIIHGVFENPRQKEATYFYFRNSPLTEQDNEAELHKIELLKNEILVRGVPIREFETPEELGQAVESDLTREIDLLFPEADFELNSDKWHEVYRRQAVESTAPCSSLNLLATAAASWITPLVVTGAGGSGKSTLLAQFAEHLQATSPEIGLIEHYCQASSEAGDIHSLLRRTSGAMAVFLETKLKQTSETYYLAQNINTLLKQFSRRPDKWFVIILDGIDKLKPFDRADSLWWLPEKWPGNCLLVIGCGEGAKLQVAQRRGWRLIPVEPLLPEEIAQVSERYFARFRKKLQAEQIEQLMQSATASRPNFLRSVLAELRVVGRFETLNQQIDELLSFPDANALLEARLARISNDLRKGENSDPVRACLAVLLVSEAGLTEEGLLDLSARQTSRRLPAAIWSSILYALEDVFTQRGNKIVINSYYEDAVRRFVFAKDTAREVLLRGNVLGFERGQKRLENAHFQLALWRDPNHSGRQYWSTVLRILSVPPFSMLLGRNFFFVYHLYSICRAVEPCASSFPLIFSPYHPKTHEITLLLIDLNLLWGRLWSAEVIIEDSLTLWEAQPPEKRKEPRCDLLAKLVLLKYAGAHFDSAVKIARELKLQDYLEVPSESVLARKPGPLRIASIGAWGRCLMIMVQAFLLMAIYCVYTVLLMFVIWLIVKMLAFVGIHIDLDAYIGIIVSSIFAFIYLTKDLPFRSYLSPKTLPYGILVVLVYPPLAGTLGMVIIDLKTGHQASWLKSILRNGIDFALIAIIMTTWEIDMWLGLLLLAEGAVVMASGGRRIKDFLTNTKPVWHIDWWEQVTRYLWQS